MHNWLLAFRQLCFHVRAVLYLIPPHHWRPTENLIAELLEWAFVNVQKSTIHFVPVPFPFAQQHPHHQFIHIFWFTSLYALPSSIQYWSSSATVSCSWMSLKNVIWNCFFFSSFFLTRTFLTDGALSLPEEKPTCFSYLKPHNVKLVCLSGFTGSEVYCGEVQYLVVQFCKHFSEFCKEWNVISDWPLQKEGLYQSIE